MLAVVLIEKEAHEAVWSVIPRHCGLPALSPVSVCFSGLDLCAQDSDNSCALLLVSRWVFGWMAAEITFRKHYAANGK